MNLFIIFKSLFLTYGPLLFVLAIPVGSFILYLLFLILTICFRKKKVPFTIFLLLTLIFITIACVTGFAIFLICSTFYLIIAGM